MKIVTFEIAKKLADNGFDKPTLLCYNDNGEIPKLLPDVFEQSKNNFYRAPNIYEVLEWLREEKRIDAGALWDNRDDKWIGYINKMDMPDLVGEYVLPNTYDTYEEATFAVIEDILNNLI
jgi:hypothetical protein